MQDLTQDLTQRRGSEPYLGVTDCNTGHHCNTADNIFLYIGIILILEDGIILVHIYILTALHYSF